jgi:hypothetical protein
MPTEKDLEVEDRAQKLYTKLFFARDKSDQHKMIIEAMTELFKKTRHIMKQHYETQDQSSDNQ